jgi:hypothetical protein
VSGTGCRLTESDGQATRGSSGLLGGAFFMFLFIAPPSRRWRSSSPLSGAFHAPLNAKAQRALLAIRWSRLFGVSISLYVSRSFLRYLC